MADPKVDLNRLTPEQRTRLTRIIEKLPAFQQSEKTRDYVREALLATNADSRDALYGLITNLIWVMILDHGAMRGPARDDLNSLIDKLWDTFDDVRSIPGVQAILDAHTAAKRGGRDATAESLKALDALDKAQRTISLGRKV